jgi:hypothetical protein
MSLSTLGLVKLYKIKNQFIKLEINHHIKYTPRKRIPQNKSKYKVESKFSKSVNTPTL